MRPLKNIIFDLDGTLIDSSDGVVAAVNYALEQAGVSLPPPEEIKRFIGYSLETTFAHFTNLPPAQLKESFRIKAADTIVAATHPLPGVEAVLAEIRAKGFRTAIATTKITPNIEGILDKLNWRTFFDTYAGGNEVRQVKPHPEILHLTLERLGADPDETIMIGDTINDILAAKAVPLPVLAIASPWESREKVISAAPDYFVESIMALPGVLEEINAQMETKP